MTALDTRLAKELPHPARRDFISSPGQTASLWSKVLLDGLSTGTALAIAQYCRQAHSTCWEPLYLAYDLLGGEHGPLRTLTRGVTYGLLFGGGYGVALGPVFGLVTGVPLGITLSWELARAARHGPEPGIWHDIAMSAIRGCGFGLGAGYLYGATFGVTFAVLSTVGQAVAYRAGIRPTLDYSQSTRPRLTRRQYSPQSIGQ